MQTIAARRPCAMRSSWYLSLHTVSGAAQVAAAAEATMAVGWRQHDPRTTHGRGGSDAISGCLAEGCILSRSAYYATIHSRYDTPCYDTPHATITCYATVHSRMAAATLAFARLCQLGSLRAERQLHSIEVWSLLASDMYIVAAQVSHLRRRTGRSAVYNL